jgi:PAS domain S-box-containing protein
VLNPDHQLGRTDAQELYDIAPCGYLSTASDGTILGVNQTLLDWMGYAREELLSSHRFQDLLTAPGRIFYETQFAPLLQLQGMVKAVAFDLVRRDTTALPALLNAARRKNAAGVFVSHIAIFDATDRRNYERELVRGRNELEQKVALRTSELAQEASDRKQAEDNLRELTARLLQLRDDEQRRLARALHDSVGQLLAALAMNNSAIRRENNLGEPARAALDENIEMTDRILTEVRTISYLLHPPLLDETGLGSALSWYIEGLNKRSALTISLEIAPEFGRLPAETETAIFRIVQECLTNIHRHSKAQRASVYLVRAPDFIALTIADEGQGMPSEKIDAIKAGRTTGVGLRGMRERIRQLQGTLEISSTDKGTIIQVRLPTGLETCNTLSATLA